MICITGAGGTVGGEVLKQLESAKAPFRAAYFSEAKTVRQRRGPEPHGGDRGRR